MIRIYIINNDPDTPFLVLRHLKSGYACWFVDYNTTLAEAVARVFDDASCWHAPDITYALEGNSYQLIATSPSLEALYLNYPELFI